MLWELFAWLSGGFHTLVFSTMTDDFGLPFHCQEYFFFYPRYLVHVQVLLPFDFGMIPLRT